MLRLHLVMLLLQELMILTEVTGLIKYLSPLCYHSSFVNFSTGT